MEKRLFIASGVQDVAVSEDYLDKCASAGMDVMAALPSLPVLSARTTMRTLSAVGGCALICSLQ
jgi:hypothetical protein